jgi:N-methylhydantoinase A/oxoprolinase/acetone carboxylase beta subunit
VIQGPALLEQMDSTIVLEPDDTMEVDPFGNLILTLNS